MTTPNGQHPLDPSDPERSTRQATSTVLALDGWGPMIAEPASNGANGSDPEGGIAAPVSVEPPATRPDWRHAMRSGWERRREIGKPTIDPQLTRLFASASTLMIALYVGLQLGSAYQRHNAPTPQPPPPSGIAALRRTIALVIDPSLRQPETEQAGWRRWLNQRSLHLS